jgi:YegS/Rv2252/BmrU family lipid kinase
MLYKKIHFIINPASGQQEPILSYLNGAFAGTEIEWEISVTKAADDASRIAQDLLGKTDLVAVYGGDGSVAQVAQVLRGTDTPMAIIPGGTANVVSKELGIPQSTPQALELLKSDAFEVIHMDMAEVNELPFLIRVNFGIMADMVIEASRELKDKVGQLAYGITALRTMAASQPISYRMVIDGEEVIQSGVALTVTNCGNIGIGNYSFLPDISVNDGYLDVLLLREASLLSVLKVTGTTLLQTGSEVVLHWPCREVKIVFTQPEPCIVDDFEHTAQSLHIKVLPGILKVVVPKKKST